MVYSGYTSKLQIVRPRLKYCASCHGELKFKYKQGEKTEYFLNKTDNTKYYAYHCVQPECELLGVPILPPMRSLKYSSISYELLLKIANHRLDEKLTFDRIAYRLKQDAKLTITNRQLENLFDRYLLLVGSQPEEEVLESLRDTGNVIINLDGVKPKKGDKILYIISDQISGEILLARTLRRNNTRALQLLLRAVKAMKLPIKGFISDKQRSIVNAIAKEFPEQLHQFCQFHYLQNISKRFEKEDLALRKRLRKAIKPIFNTIKTAERQFKAGKISDQSVHLLHELYEELKLASIEDAKYPFEPVGIPFYQYLVEFHKTIKLMDKAGPINIFRTVRKHLEKMLEANKPQFNKLRLQLRYLFEIEELLEVDKFKKGRRQRRKAESAIVKYIEKRLKAASRAKASQADKELLQWWETVKKVTISWLPGLFTYVENPLLPRTNNQMEQLIHSIKSDFKFLRGEKFIHRYLLRRGEHWIFARQIQRNQIPVSAQIERLRNVDPDRYLQEAERLTELADHFRRKRRSRGNYRESLRSIRLQWPKNHGVR